MYEYNHTLCTVQYNSPYLRMWGHRCIIYIYFISKCTSFRFLVSWLFDLRWANCSSLVTIPVSTAGSQLGGTSSQAAGRPDTASGCVIRIKSKPASNKAKILRICTGFQGWTCPPDVSSGWSKSSLRLGRKKLRIFTGFQGWTQNPNASSGSSQNQPLTKRTTLEDFYRVSKPDATTECYIKIK
jgi:hypothetical protein